LGVGKSILPNNITATIMVIKNNIILIKKPLPIPVLVFFENCIYYLLISN
jgi:hypothetical protein